MQRPAMPFAVTCWSFPARAMTERLVKENPPQLRIRREDGGHQAAVSAGHVHECPEPGELVGRCDRRVLRPGDAGHGLAKELEVLRVLLEILEDRNTVGLEERQLAGFDSVEELVPGVKPV